jgi:hypothetical protein
MSKVGALTGHCITRRISPYVLSAAILLFAAPLHSQQTDVKQFDVYAGYAFLDTPSVNLFENGVAAQIGFRPKTWLTVGFDIASSQ